jgi:hypothetical protein
LRELIAPTSNAEKALTISFLFRLASSSKQQKATSGYDCKQTSTVWDDFPALVRMEQQINNVSALNDTFWLDVPLVP